MLQHVQFSNQYFNTVIINDINETSTTVREWRICFAPKGLRFFAFWGATRLAINYDAKCAARIQNHDLGWKEGNSLRHGQFLSAFFQFGWTAEASVAMH